MLILLAVYHAGYLGCSKRGRSELRALLFRFQDARDAFRHICYYFGLRREPPAFGRFNYFEKFEYFAVVWGSLIMIATGFLLWFETQAMVALPKWALMSASGARYEAVLAFLTILIWHMYCVHFNPDVFPMSRIWLDGRITEAEMNTTTRWSTMSF